eukprot:Nk52_evm79s62 gene=Nk52_evmTU79s62
MTTEAPKIKRPSSAYLYYTKAAREEVKSAGFAGKEVLRELGKRWNLLTEEQKKVLYEFHSLFTS